LSLDNKIVMDAVTISNEIHFTHGVYHYKKWHISPRSGKLNIKTFHFSP